jgi:hypothetical protein
MEVSSGQIGMLSRIREHSSVVERDCWGIETYRPGMTAAIFHFLFGQLGPEGR